MRREELEEFLAKSGLSQITIDQIVHDRFLSLDKKRQETVDKSVVNLWVLTAGEDTSVRTHMLRRQYMLRDDDHQEEMTRYWMHCHDSTPSTGARRGHA